MAPAGRQLPDGRTVMELVDAVVRNPAVAEEADQRHLAELVFDRRELG